MLAGLRVSRRRERWIELRLDSALSLSEDGDLTVDVNALKSLICPPDFSWACVASACCRTISPVYNGLWNSVQEDFDTVARVLAELGPPSEEGEGDVGVGIDETSTSSSRVGGEEPPPPAVDLLLPRRKRRRSSLARTQTEPFTIHCGSSFAPAIVVTPAPPRGRETSGWVPIQDKAFGRRLTVPAHAALNEVFPPLAVASRSGPSLPLQPVLRWEYADGHWVAVLHSLEEQARRGMHSKGAAGWRQRKWRRPGRSKSGERRSVLSI